MPGTELGVGYVSLVPSARGFGRSIIREAQAAGTSAGNTAANSFGSNFVSGVSKWAKRGAIALGAGLSTAGFFGIKAAADFEQTRIAFEGILGNKEAADKLIASLRDLANTSPFQFADLSKSARQLLATGFALDEITPNMETLGNVAATLGAGQFEIEGVVRALGQMKGKGKVSAEELRQISEQFPGFSAIKVIADEVGISVGELADIMEGPGGLLNIGIDGAKGVQLILDGMEKFPGAAGAMERQSKTLNGVISTFKDTLTTTAIDFITPYLPALSSGIQTLSGWITTTLVPALQNFVDWVGDIVDRVGPSIVALFRDHINPTVKGLATDALAAISDWWDRNGDDIVGFFEDLGTALGAIAEPIGTWIWETMLPAFADLGGFLIDNEAILVGALAGITAGMLAYAAAATVAAIANVIAFLPFILIGVAIAALAGLIFLLWQNSELFRESVGTTIALILLFGPSLIDFFRTLWGWALVAVGALQAVADAVQDIIDLAPQLPGGLGLDDVIGGTPLGPLLEGLERFDDGGVKGGPRGVHQLAWVAGGETVLPTHKAELSDLVGGRGPLIGSLSIVGELGEDPVDRAFREARRASMLAGA